MAQGITRNYGIDAGSTHVGSGYYRGSPPVAGGTGSMAGPRGAGGSPSAKAMGQWHPTVINLVVLVLLELGGYVALRYAFRHVHGG
jgi:hypothetical protein